MIIDNRKASSNPLLSMSFTWQILLPTGYHLLADPKESPQVLDRNPEAPRLHRLLLSPPSPAGEPSHLTG